MFYSFVVEIKGFGTTFQGISALSAHLKVPERKLQAVLNDYREAASGKKLDPFGKTTFPVSFEENDTFRSFLSFFSF